jgi:Uma2 family endonuclease
MSTAARRSPVEPEPAWEVARLFPAQGEWTEAEYLDLTRSTNRLVEFSDGVVEVLPMPTDLHQRIVAFLYRALFAFVSAHDLGAVRFAALRVRLWEGKFREPDVLFLEAAHAARLGDEFWDGADLVMEVVSKDDPARDRDLKRAEYARAGIPEYWIVDPLEGRIVVLALPEGGASYEVHGTFGRGERAASRLLPGFAVDVAEALAPRH